MHDKNAGGDRLIAALQQELASLEERISTIEHELHDGPLQRVIAARMQMQALLSNPELTPDLSDQFEELDQSLALAVSQVRSILQSNHQPSVPDPLCLDTLCQELAEPVFRVKLDGPAKISGVSEELWDAVLRVVRELIWNARKHSQADGVTVTSQENERTWGIEVRDQGKGFDPEQIPEDSYGLCTAVERARMMGFDLVIDSVRGEGTRITLRGTIA